jgi:type I restriction-modification system DNA methylase subunit
MPNLTLNEIRTRLRKFAVKWKGTERENADAKLFWARFYECYGISPEDATVYEKKVATISGGRGFIDSFIPGKLIVEHKSKGKDLNAAFNQAADYYLALPEHERPRYIITSDFANFRLYDLRKDTERDCTLAELPKKAEWFNFLNDEEAEIEEEENIDGKAAYAVSRLHETLLRAGFKGRNLEVFLTRLLFCFFADDTGIFGENQIFRRYVEKTKIDGSDTGGRLATLFDVLDTPENERQSNLDEALAKFAYINGSLFSERTRIPAFSGEMRGQLIKCAALDWSGISPAIFGSMFQGVLEAHTPDETRQASRRELGAHYTSEHNILRVINPLFMDDLRAEFQKAKNNKPRLKALYDLLPTLNLLDPACGCGNFLVMAYRELRRLEVDVAAAFFQFDRKSIGLFDVSEWCRVRVTQFYGIEIDEAAAHIARVALWITDHQMNLEAAARFGNARPSVPLVDTPHIHNKNALRTDWAEILPPEQCTYVLGNPPFIGKQRQKDEQKADMEMLFSKVKGAGVLDFVAAWYIKALPYIQANPNIDVSFVSTNSITQGEQVAILWALLLQAGVKIRFAHRTFKWSNEGKGIAAVHCVIIGFGLRTPDNFVLFDYENVNDEEGERLEVKQINPYLVEASNLLMVSRRSPVCPVSPIVFGSMPNDGGNLLLSDQERKVLIQAEPKAGQWIKPFLGADEFINNLSRWCLWLVGIEPSELRAMPEVQRRVQAVKRGRLDSSRPTTQELADTAYLFGEIRQPERGTLIVVPAHSSETREYLPIGFETAKTIIGNANLMIPKATVYDFAILNSTIHNAWMRAVCGRIKSDYRYSAGIVYNNFPFPEPTDAQRQAIERTGQAILDAREAHSGQTLAELYDPSAMPADLRKAHNANDKAVERAYGYKGSDTDAKRVAFLFDRYEALTSLLPTAKKATKRARKTATE